MNNSAPMPPKSVCFTLFKNGWEEGGGVLVLENFVYLFIYVRNLYPAYLKRSSRWLIAPAAAAMAKGMPTKCMLSPTHAPYSCSCLHFTRKLWGKLAVLGDTPCYRESFSGTWIYKSVMKKPRKAMLLFGGHHGGPLKSDRRAVPSGVERPLEGVQTHFFLTSYF